MPTRCGALRLNRIFLSHSRLDTDLAPWFDTVLASEKVEGVRFGFDFEAQEGNPIEELQRRLESCAAFFVLLSPPVVGRTLHTSNWVSAEVGLAHGLGKPIWVFDRTERPIQFPVPFASHYYRLSLGPSQSSNADSEFVRAVVRAYGSTTPPEEPWEGAGFLRCPQAQCQAVFQIHQSNREIDRCPVCCTATRWDTALVPCASCKGKGTATSLFPYPPFSACQNCGGSGWFLVDMGSGSCPGCEGQGRVLIMPAAFNPFSTCKRCRGTRYQRWQPMKP
jgi:hypothetical protein